MMSLQFQNNWVAQKNIFFYHFEEFDLNNPIQLKFHYRPPTNVTTFSDITV
jgi:hypothetical protein